ncbi:hypothetical protein AB835_11145 [Candidatus Endobugula sertula]|uniref:VWFA domain-containing protein n=1 Tax=Candidatus Endobugula sertula TaxID=62101 RepID=A0A1D2QN46_9GAMM|nr:hypothetical protein AB835_11145 [Candidatus Endobugula sertula]
MLNGLRKRFVIICAISLLWVAQVLAQTEEPEVKKASDVRMVIDISGSMRKNDPNNLRRPALDMLVQLLPKGSKAGVWTFGQYVNMLVPHRLVDKKWAKQASTLSNEIKSIAQFTNIGEALEKAAYDHQSVRDDYQKHIILLTDGMVDIHRNPDINSKERQRILDQVVPMYQQAGLTLHTIALSDNADRQLLTKLALTTDGKAVVAKTAEELMNAFLQVFNQAVPVEELPFEDNSFFTDSSIEELTALIFRKSGSPEAQLIGPDQVVYTKDSQDRRVSWYRTDQYDLITVKQPLEGQWRVIAELDAQSRITVVSDLSLAVKSMPTNISIDDTIETSLVLREENKIVSRPEFLRLLEVDVTIARDQKGIWARRISDGEVPSNGIYSVTMDTFNQPGHYTLTFTVDGKTFKRQFTHSLSVRQPFDVNVNKIEHNSKTQFTVQVVSQSQRVVNDKTEVVGKLKKPSGTSHIVKFSPTGDGNWALSISPEEQGNYQLSIRATAVTNDGDNFDFIPEPIQLSHQPDDSVFGSLAEPELQAQEEEPTVSEVEKNIEELVEKHVEDESDMSQIILYSALGLVNLLIILVVYFLYRKLFNKKSNDNSEESTDEDDASEFTEPPMDEMIVDEGEPELESEEEEMLDDTSEPIEAAIDSNNVDTDSGESEMGKEQENSEVSADKSFDLDESPNDVDSETAVEADINEGIDLGDDEIKDDELAGILDGEEDIEEEVPDFSLDDFGPESLDEDGKQN